MMATASRSERDARRAKVREALKAMMVFSDDDPEVAKFSEKVAELRHEYREGRLFVGKDSPPKHEIRRSKTGNVYCRCPDFAFRQREGRAGGTGVCKHVAFALCMDLEIPATGEGGL